MSTKSTQESGPTDFKSVVQSEVPRGRDGKHKQIVLQLLSNIAQLKPGTALKIPLSELPSSKENIRSALNRATNQLGIDVATASDEEHLYIWKPERKIAT
jgi:TusA-related sulfurtransferase